MAYVAERVVWHVLFVVKKNRTR